MFHLFVFDDYYPCGGMNDYEGSFSSVEEAIVAAKASWGDNYQVVSSSFSVVQRGKVEDL